MVAEDPDISNYLRVAEEPAHNNWHLKRLNESKEYTTDWQLRFIKHAAMKDLFGILAGINDEDTVIDDFAADIFKISEPTNQNDAGTKKQKKKKGENPKPKPKPKVRNPALIAIDQVSVGNGFRIHSTGYLKEIIDETPEVLPLQISIKAAYAVIKGRNASFNQYSKLDFDLAEGNGISVEAVGDAEILNKEQNIIEAKINSPEFSIVANGFDKIRDLLVKVDS